MVQNLNLSILREVIARTWKEGREQQTRPCSANVTATTSPTLPTNNSLQRQKTWSLDFSTPTLTWPQQHTLHPIYPMAPSTCNSNKHKDPPAATNETAAAKRARTKGKGKQKEQSTDASEGQQGRHDENTEAPIPPCRRANPAPQPSQPSSATPACQPLAPIQETHRALSPLTPSTSAEPSDDGLEGGVQDDQNDIPNESNCDGGGGNVTAPAQDEIQQLKGTLLFSATHHS